MMTAEGRMRMTKEENSLKIRKFTDLKAWQVARQMVKEVYQATYTFPKEEQFGLVSQMKRAAVSIASNIAEGFRRDTMKDKLHFYVISHGSLTELQNQVILAHDLEFLDFQKFENLMEQCDRVDALIGGLIRATKERV
jgi:four helix bundle protein